MKLMSLSTLHLPMGYLCPLSTRADAIQYHISNENDLSPLGLQRYARLEALQPGQPIISVDFPLPLTSSPRPRPTGPRHQSRSTGLDDSLNLGMDMRAFQTHLPYSVRVFRPSVAATHKDIAECADTERISLKHSSCCWSSVILQ